MQNNLSSYRKGLNLRSGPFSQSIMQKLYAQVGRYMCVLVSYGEDPYFYEILNGVCDQKKTT